MPIITFETPRRRWVVGIEPAMVADRTLLAIARACRVPVLFNCEVGDCGACLVTVAGEAEDIGRALTDKERFLLGAMGKLTAASTGGSQQGPDGKRMTGAAHRLACQAGVGAGDLTVRFDTTIGG